MQASKPIAAENLATCKMQANLPSINYENLGCYHSQAIPYAVIAQQIMPTVKNGMSYLSIVLLCCMLCFDED